MISITQGIIANNKKKDLINLVKHSPKNYNDIEKKLQCHAMSNSNTNFL